MELADTYQTAPRPFSYRTRTRDKRRSNAQRKTR